jgi:hypothetical protein
MVKVHSQPNPHFVGGTSNPLSVLGPLLFPTGNSNAPVEQLRNFYHLGSPSSDKAAALGSDIPGKIFAYLERLLIFDIISAWFASSMLF